MATVSLGGGQSANRVVKLASRKSKQAAEAPAGHFGNELRPISVVMRLARVLWPNKTAMELAHRTNVTQRQAEYWLAGKYDLSADALAGLIRSEEGLKILEEIIGPSARPLWWKDFRRSVRRGELMRRQAELAQELDRIQMLEDL